MQSKNNLKNKKKYQKQKFPIPTRIIQLSSHGTLSGGPELLLVVFKSLCGLLSVHCP
jgi:hypothetical protein